MVRTRKAFRRKDGTFVRGTVVKPKFFKRKMAVDLDFHTKTKYGKSGMLRGRSNIKTTGERVPVIRTTKNKNFDDGIIIGRAKKMSYPYPKRYTVFSKVNGKIKRKQIPVTKW